MPRISQPDSAGLQLSPIEASPREEEFPRRIVGDDGLQTVSGPHIVRPPSYASNHRRSNNPAATRDVVAGSRRSELPSTGVITSAAPLASVPERSDSEPTAASASTLKVEQEQLPLLEKKKQWGLTWKQWLLVIAPSVVIIAVAAIVAGVLVSKRNTNSSTSPEPIANNSAPDTNPSVVSKSGAFNGTDIALAHPGLTNETLWMFYQDFEGDLSFVALDNQGLWHQKGKIPTVNGLANGSAITAINFPLHDPSHINLLYVDSTGQIRNKLYNNKTQTFQDGYIYKKVFTMPPAITTIRRMSWYADNNKLFYMYAGGTDGLMHEYTYDSTINKWQPTSDFVRSNGFSGATVTPDTNLSTLHLVNSEGNLVLWTRPPPNDSGVPRAWSQGAASQQLPVSVYANSTLQLDKKHNQVIFQDTTGELQVIGFRGEGVDAQWNAPLPTGVKARLGASVKAIRGIYPGPLNSATHVFTQVNGNDITHFVRANNTGALTALETPVT